MKVFILPPEYAGGDKLELKGEDFHCLCRVRRFKEGDSFPARDAAGNEYHLSMEKTGRKSCRLHVQKKGPSVQAGEEVSLCLYQCLPKDTKFDTIVLQAVEMGVTCVVPVRSRYAVTMIADEKDRLAHWRRIAREAVQQYGASCMPEIRSPVDLAEIPRDFGPCNNGKRLGIVFHQYPLEIRSLHGYLSCCPKEVALVTGPEGGFADEELALLREAGFVPAWLGHRVLRCETAPVFAVAAVRIILLEREKWNPAHEN